MYYSTSGSYTLTEGGIAKRKSYGAGGYIEYRLKNVLTAKCKKLTKLKF
jgi:hypothetical protein